MCVRAEIEVPVGKCRASGAEATGQGGIFEEANAGVGDRGRRGDRKDERFLPVPNLQAEVGRREHDGTSAREKLGQLGWQAEIVKFARGAGLDQHVGKSEQAGQAFLVNEPEVDRPGLPVSGERLKQRGRVEPGPNQAGGVPSLIEFLDRQV